MANSPRVPTYHNSRLKNIQKRNSPHGITRIVQVYVQTNYCNGHVYLSTSYKFIGNSRQKCKARSPNSSARSAAYSVMTYEACTDVDVDVDGDGVDERRPKPLCPHRINTLQYTSLLIFLTHTFTATSSSVQLCFKIVYNILILPKFI